jgi:hypothetical protein
MSGPAAGWYDDPEMVNTRRYWDGEKWTQHRQEKPAATQARSTPCPYCTTPMAAGARRCPACSGELYFCHKDQAWVGVNSKSINVGLLRGGRQWQHRCMKCNRVIAGPHF